MLFLISFAFVLSACEKDEEEKAKDVRDQAVGIYNYTLSLAFIDEDGTFIEIEEAEEQGTFTVKKNDSDNKKIDFFEDGKLVFSGSKIAEASNGFTFDIPEQTFENDDLGTITIAGFDMFELGTTRYNGVFYSADKKIQAAFQTVLQTNFEIGEFNLTINTPLILAFEAIKQ
jgi:hypothetical protein